MVPLMQTPANILDQHWFMQNPIGYREKLIRSTSDKFPYLSQSHFKDECNTEIILDAKTLASAMSKKKLPNQRR